MTVEEFEALTGRKLDGKYHKQETAEKTAETVDISEEKSIIEDEECEAYYTGLKDKISVAKSKFKNAFTGEKYKQVSDDYLSSLPKTKAQESMEKALKATNPFHHTDNCQRCVPAYEMRRRGYNVIAGRPPKNFAEDNIGMGEGYKKLFIDAYWRTCTTGKEKEELFDFMAKCSDGARFQIAYRGEYGNHMFVAERYNGKSILIDPQNPDRDLTRIFGGEIEELVFGRIDNCEFSNLIKECIEVK